VTLIEYIQSEIRKALNDITDDCINGGCVDFPQYRYECGRAIGLVMAEEIIKVALSKAEGNDETNDQQ
jgi:hypothetical protein